MNTRFGTIGRGLAIGASIAVAGYAGPVAWHRVLRLLKREAERGVQFAVA